MGQAAVSAKIHANSFHCRRDVTWVISGRVRRLARIVLGLASSHTPQLNTAPDIWADHAERDRRNPELLGLDGAFHDYAGIERMVPRDLAGELTSEAWEAKHARAQEAVASLHATLRASAADVVVVVGDDQRELFLDDGTPTFGVFVGDEIWDMPLSAEKLAARPKGLQAANWAVHGEEPERYVTAAGLASHIVEQMMIEEFDVSQFRRQPEGRTLGHAFTFVRRRIMRDHVLPMVPVLVNSYYPPNQPTPRRCYNFGRALRRAIESWDEDLAVAIVASGGLSHFVVDEEFDRRVIEGLQRKDLGALSAIPRRYFRSGTSESLNWITAGGALEALDMKLVDYVPGYRTPAGTGCGMTFACWQ